MADVSAAVADQVRVDPDVNTMDLFEDNPDSFVQMSVGSGGSPELFKIKRGGVWVSIS